MNSAAAPRMAVITANTLTGLGLRSILEKIIPFAEVRLYRSFGEFAADRPDETAHCFVDLQTFVAHADWFSAPQRRAIVLVSSAQAPHAEGMAQIDISNGEEQIVRDILRLHGRGHTHGHPGHLPASQPRSVLTQREREVLVLIARGMMSKEIADRLGIALTTVISHRRHITAKLGLKSISALTIYAVTRGYVDADSI